MCRGLATLAALAAAWEESDGVTHIDGALPLLLDCLRAMKTQATTPAQVATELVRRYGIQLSTRALEALISRARRRAHVYDEKSDLNVSPTPRWHPALERWHAEVRADERVLLNYLVASSAADGRIAWTHVEAAEALQGWLKQALASGTGGWTLPVAPLSRPPLAGDLFLLSLFLPRALDAEVNSRRFLTRVVVGAIILRSLDLSRPRGVHRPLHGAGILFDARCLAYALGFADPERRAFFRQLLALTRQAGGDPQASADTILELRRALSAGREILRAGGGFWPNPPTDLEACLANSARSMAEIEMLAIRLEANLRELGVTISGPEDGLTGVLDESATAAEFVMTADRPVVRVKHRLGESEAWPTDQDLASGQGPLSVAGFFTLLWPRQPVGDAILAWVRSACRDLLAPSARLWETYVSKVESARSAGRLGEIGYALLTASKAAPVALMNLTLGDPAVLFVADTDRLVEAVRAEAQGELRVRLAAAKRQVGALRREAERLTTDLQGKTVALASGLVRGLRWVAVGALLASSAALIAFRNPALVIPLLVTGIVTGLLVLGGPSVDRTLSRLERSTRVALQERLRSWLEL